MGGAVDLPADGREPVLAHGAGCRDGIVTRRGFRPGDGHEPATARRVASAARRGLAAP